MRQEIMFPFFSTSKGSLRQSRPGCDLWAPKYPLDNPNNNQLAEFTIPHTPDERGMGPWHKLLKAHCPAPAGRHLQASSGDSILHSFLPPASFSLTQQHSHRNRCSQPLGRCRGPDPMTRPFPSSLSLVTFLWLGVKHHTQSQLKKKRVYFGPEFQRVKNRS